MKVAYIDRDGTINKDYPDADWRAIKEPEFLPNAIEGLKQLSNMGFKLIIITNQYLINDGIITQREYHAFQSKLIQCLEQEGIMILKTYYCPHSAHENCDCMKPKTGMIKQSLLEFPEIQLDQSIVVGDAFTDEQLAERMNLSFYGINGKNYRDAFNSILDVAKEISHE